MSDASDQSETVGVLVPLNPYAPSSAVDGSVPILSPRVSVLVVTLNTIAGVTASGGIFGFGLIVATTTELASVAPFALVVGCILAFVGASVVVPLGLLARSFLGDSARDWTGSQILRFGAACGGLTGFLCLAVPAMFDPVSLTYALFPALAGALLTPLFLLPLSRRVTVRQNSLLDSLEAFADGEFGR